MTTRADTPEELTPREREVLEHLRIGLTDGETAERLGVTTPAVSRHVSQIIGKLGVRNRYEAAAWPDRPPWWASSLAPVALLWRKAGAMLPFRLSTAAAVLSGGLFVAALAGIGLVVFLLMRGGDEKGQLVVAPTATPFAERDGFDGFREFAKRIELALDPVDDGFFLDRAEFYEYVCPQEHKWTPCQELGERVDVIQYYPLAPANSALLGRDTLGTYVSQLSASARPNASDAYGTGALRLHSISRRNRGDGTDEYRAVLTRMSGPSPTEASRQVHILSFTFSRGRWAFDTMMSGRVQGPYDVHLNLERQPEDLNWELRPAGSASGPPYSVSLRYSVGRRLGSVSMSASTS